MTYEQVYAHMRAGRCTATEIIKYLRQPGEHERAQALLNKMYARGLLVLISPGRRNVDRRFALPKDSPANKDDGFDALRNFRAPDKIFNRSCRP